MNLEPYKEWMTRRSYNQKAVVYAFLLLAYFVGGMIGLAIFVGGMVFLITSPVMLITDGLVIEGIILALIYFLVAGVTIARMEQYLKKHWIKEKER